MSSMMIVSWRQSTVYIVRPLIDELAGPLTMSNGMCECTHAHACVRAHTRDRGTHTERKEWRANGYIQPT